MPPPIPMLFDVGSPNPTPTKRKKRDSTPLNPRCPNQQCERLLESRDAESTKRVESECLLRASQRKLVVAEFRLTQFTKITSELQDQVKQAEKHGKYKAGSLKA